ncbi:MAG: molybdopterin-guanine dinucleotide biosynthesis protein MobA [Actinobacteria bacterium]|nr:molybdopterin-guanine dinucleotide biosynthesis protein MobA [Actinomycetota bacterium]
MSDWLRRFADALDEEPLPPEEISAILDLTRDVAHGTERKLAPLTSYLVGIQLGRQLEGGADRGEAFDETVDRVLATLPDDPD